MLKSKRQRLGEVPSDHERQNENETGDNTNLFNLIEKISEMKKDDEGNDWLSEIDIPFNAILVKEDLLPEYSFSRVTLSALPEDIKDVTFRGKFRNKLPTLGIEHDMPGDNIYEVFWSKSISLAVYTIAITFRTHRIASN